MGRAAAEPARPRPTPSVVLPIPPDPPGPCGRGHAGTLLCDTHVPAIPTRRHSRARRLPRRESYRADLDACLCASLKYSEAGNTTLARIAQASTAVATTHIAPPGARRCDVMPISSPLDPRFQMTLAKPSHRPHSGAAIDRLGKRMLRQFDFIKGIVRAARSSRRNPESEGPH